MATVNVIKAYWQIVLSQTVNVYCGAKLQQVERFYNQ